MHSLHVEKEEPGAHQQTNVSGTLLQTIDCNRCQGVHREGLFTMPSQRDIAPDSPDSASAANLTLDRVR